MTSQEEPIRITHDQKWFQLGTILSTPFSLPMIIIGWRLAKEYGAGKAICSILVGNLILWLIGMSVISMAIEDRSNAVENVKRYLGKYGALFMWLILMISILNWFLRQITAVIPSIGLFFGEESSSTLVRLGAGLGFFVTLLSIGGIRLIKWATLISFPFIFCYYVFAISQSDHSIDIIDSWGLSVPAIISTTLVLLPGMVNLPTLYRHARSKADSYLGLTVMTLLMSFYEIAAIWMNFTAEGNIIYSSSKLFSLATLIFISLTLIYINLINIYFASACWETYFPRFEGAKGYVITGLMGTAAYTFIQIKLPILFLADVTNCYIGSLGIVLMIACLVRMIVKHRPRPMEKVLNGVAWLTGCIVSTFLILQNMNDFSRPLLLGTAASALAFLLIIFAEETIWSVKKLLGKK